MRSCTAGGAGGDKRHFVAYTNGKSAVRLADGGAGTPHHGLYPDTMALVTSDRVTMCSPSIKWP